MLRHLSDSLPTIIWLVSLSGFLGASAIVALASDLLSLATAHLYAAYLGSTVTYRWMAILLGGLFDVFRGESLRVDAFAACRVTPLTLPCAPVPQASGATSSASGSTRRRTRSTSSSSARSCSRRSCSCSRPSWPTTRSSRARARPSSLRTRRSRRRSPASTTTRCLRSCSASSRPRVCQVRRSLLLPSGWAGCSPPPCFSCRRWRARSANRRAERPPAAQQAPGHVGPAQATPCVPPLPPLPSLHSPWRRSDPPVCLSPRAQSCSPRRSCLSITRRSASPARSSRARRSRRSRTCRGPMDEHAACSTSCASGARRRAGRAPRLSPWGSVSGAVRGSKRATLTSRSRAGRTQGS